MYADDTKLFSEAKKKCAANLQEDLDGLVDWELCFNADKCKVIHMGRSNPGYTYNMKTHGTGERMVLGTTDSEKDLGVLVDNELNFSKHVEAHVCKANRILVFIRRSYQYLDSETMRLIFTALV